MMKQAKNEIYPFMLCSKAMNLWQKTSMKKTRGYVIKQSHGG